MIADSDYSIVMTYKMHCGIHKCKRIAYALRIMFTTPWLGG